MLDSIFSCLELSILLIVILLEVYLKLHFSSGDSVNCETLNQVKRVYIPLPDENVRRLLLKNKLKGQAFSLPSKNLLLWCSVSKKFVFSN